jgi:hypothetical protein
MMQLHLLQTSRNKSIIKNLPVMIAGRFFYASSEWIWKSFYLVLQRIPAVRRAHQRSRRAMIQFMAL